MCLIVTDRVLNMFLTELFESDGYLFIKLDTLLNSLIFDKTDNCLHFWILVYGRHPNDPQHTH